MDEKDIEILKMLISNSRVPYREIADQLGLSVNGVYKRIKNLQNSNVIRGFSISLDPRILNAFPITIFGQCDASSIEKVISDLGKSENTQKISIAGGNYLYINAIFRDLRELQPYIKMVKKKGGIPTPLVGILRTRKSIESRLEDLSSLDFRIISALQGDSRRFASDIAKEIGVSTKTARKRLARLTEEEYIKTGVTFALDSSRDIFAMLHLKLGKGQEINKTEAMLINNFSSNIIYLDSYSNLPNLILCSLWAPTMKEIKEIQNGMKKKGAFESMIPRIFYTTHIYDSWMDTIIDDLVSKPGMMEEIKKKQAKSRSISKKKMGQLDLGTLRKVDTYRKALVQALKDGVITEDEEAILTSLRDSLKITDEQHGRIMEFVNMEGNMDETVIEAYRSALGQALDDSVITEDEENILLSLRDSLSITDEVHEEILNSLKGKKKTSK
ncbi:MAG: winged helix-turn-helix transcriptional regulator [Thermoplasmata archaeon]|nr:MAG: winged helix-turn-helix transcriptional regulator [Thermoplasmata archaeon]